MSESIEEEFSINVGYDFDVWGFPIAILHEISDDGDERLSIYILCFYLNVEIRDV